MWDPFMSRTDSECSVPLERPPRIHFDVHDPELHDVVILVENKKYYCDKQFLADNSSYFFYQFFSMFADPDQKEHVLTEISPENFQDFLELNSGLKVYSDDSVESILQMNRKLNSAMVIKECHDFLKYESMMSVQDRFEIAVAYDLHGLKKHLINQTKCYNELKPLIPENLMDLDLVSMGLILERSMAFNEFHPDATEAPPTPTVEDPPTLPSLITVVFQEAQPVPIPRQIVCQSLEESCWDMPSSSMYQEFDSEKKEQISNTRCYNELKLLLPEELKDLGPRTKIVILRKSIQFNDYNPDATEPPPPRYAIPENLIRRRGSYIIDLSPFAQGLYGFFCRKYLRSVEDRENGNVRK